MSSPQDRSSEAADETFATRMGRRLASYAAVIACLLAASAVYGMICEGKCAELCQKEGFPISSWNPDGGQLTRVFAVVNGRHGTCWCERERPFQNIRIPRPDRELRLRFGG